MWMENVDGKMKMVNVKCKIEGSSGLELDFE